MNLLSVDTSSENFSLSVLWKDKLLVDYNCRKKHAASEFIPYLERVSCNFNLNLSLLDAIVVGAGPGSFTGLRIGFAAVKALSMVLNTPVVSLSSLYSLAYPFGGKKRRVAVITDARRDLIYGALFTFNKGVLRRVRRERLAELDDFVRENRDYFFVTYDGHLRDKVNVRYAGIKFYAKDVYPNARWLLFAARDSWLEGKFTPLSKLKPLYIYPKTCQVRR